MTVSQTLPQLPAETPQIANADPMMTFRDWERLLNKAWSEGVWLVQSPDDPDKALCLSQTQLIDNRFVQYEVGLYDCTCPSRRPCKHRALWLFEHPEFLPFAVLPKEHEHEEALTA